MGAATALEAGERLLDLRIGRLLRSIEKCSGSHDPAVDAIAALRHLLLHIGLLDRVRLLRRAEASERDDLAVADRRQRRHAGAHGLPVNVDGAGAALREPTAEMRVVQRELIAQRVEQRHVRIGVDRLDLAVHVEIYSGHRCLSPLRCREARPTRTDLSFYPDTASQLSQANGVLTTPSSGNRISPRALSVRRRLDIAAVRTCQSGVPSWKIKSLTRWMVPRTGH